MWCRENAGECTGRCPARLGKRLEKKGKWRQRPGEILIRSLFLRGTEDSHCTRRAGQTRRITNYVGGRPRPGGPAKLAFSARFPECSARLNMRRCTPLDGRNDPSLRGHMRPLIQEIGTVKG